MGNPSPAGARVVMLDSALAPLPIAEALRLLDAMVQLSVLDRTRTTPPASPADGDRHVVASGRRGSGQGGI